MKNTIICFLCVVIILVGCSHYRESQKDAVTENHKVEISEELLDELSKDLAEIDLMIEDSKKEYENVKLSAKIVEAWKKGPYFRFSHITSSEVKDYDGSEPIRLHKK